MGEVPCSYQGVQSHRAQFPWPHLKRKGMETSFTGKCCWISRHGSMLLDPVTWEWTFSAELAHTLPRKWLFDVLGMLLAVGCGSAPQTWKRQ